MAAIDQILNNFDLLEQTLLHLPLSDILRCCRVNKLFKAVIDGSVYLQRALFLHASPPAPMSGHDADGNETIKGPRVNKLFLREESSRGELGSIIDRFQIFGDCYEDDDIARNTYGYTGHSFNCNEHPIFKISAEVHARKDDEEGSRQQAWDGSWCKMLLTQPPCRMWMDMKKRADPTAWSRTVTVELRCPTMGEVVGVLRAAYGPEAASRLKELTLVPQSVVNEGAGAFKLCELCTAEEWLKEESR